MPNIDFKMAALRCFLTIKMKLVQCIRCGEYILADRFLRNSGYLVESEVLSSLGCQFQSKRSFAKPKDTEVCLDFASKWQHSDAFLPKKINLHVVQCIPKWSIYISEEIFKEQWLHG